MVRVLGWIEGNLGIPERPRGWDEAAPYGTPARPDADGRQLVSAALRAISRPAASNGEATEVRIQMVPADHAFPFDRHRPSTFGSPCARRSPVNIRNLAARPCPAPSRRHYSAA
jgi:hypothetical protein